MSETAAATTPPKPKAKAAPAAFEMPKFEMPKFEMPKFEIPNVEVPAAFREIAEKGLSQAKENYEKMKVAAEEATDMLEDTYTTASKGASDYGLKLIEVARANTNAVFDFANELFKMKSPSEIVELTTAHARKQFESMTAQGKELTTLAQKVTTEAVEPIKNSVDKAMKMAS
jgi:phasin